MLKFLSTNRERVIKVTAFLFCTGFLFFGLAGQAEAAACGAGPFYVSTSGVDTNNGTTTSTPWLHHPWDANKSGLASCTLAAGNIVYMRRGDIWYDVYLASAQAGEAGNQIVTTSIDTWYAVSSADAYPILSGAYNPTTLAWTQVGSTNVWFTTTVATPGIVVYNDVKLTLYTNKTPPANNWFWSATDTGQGVNTLYVNVGGGSPSTGILEAGKRGYINLTSAGYQTFSYIEMRVNNNSYAVAYNNQKANVIYDNMIIKHALGSGIYQSTNTGTVVSHSTISDVSTYGIQAVSVPGISIHGNTVSDTGQHGILLTTTNGASVDNNIVHNVCKVNSVCGGILITNSNLNNVYLNNIYDNLSGYYPSGSGSGIYLVGSSENNSIYWNTIAGNYIGIVDWVTSGANGNKIFYNLVTNSVVNGIDMKQKGTGYDHVYNNTVIHNPSANNNEPYTGHGIDVQTFGYYTKIANNIVVNIAPYGGNNQAYVLSDVGSGQPIVQVWWDNNLAYATNGGDLAKLMDTGGGGNTYAGAHNGTTWANFVTVIQGAIVGHKVLGMDGVQHGAGVHDVSADPFFTSSSDFHLQPGSPAIDAGTDVSLTTDYAGNSIYGLPDIGGYEYQPPHTMGTDKVDIGAGGRVYGDGKFRDVGTTNSTTADLKITPSGGTFTETTSPIPAFLDISNITNWTTAHKTWTESNAESAGLVTDHTIGDLDNNKYYNITVSGLDANTYITGINDTTCSTVNSNQYCLSDNDGKIYFRYTGGYSTHTFDMTIDTPPTNVDLSSITADSTTQLTILAQTAVDTNSGLHTTPYYFAETTGNPGASDSIYQTSTIYTDSGLSINTLYTYKVKAKDANGNESAYSSTLSKYTLAPTPTNLTAANITPTSIILSVDTFPNATSGQSSYLFTNTNQGTNSGWIQNNSWADTGLSCSHSYDYSVIYRNGDGTETSSISTSQSTSGCSHGGVRLFITPPIIIPPVNPTNILGCASNTGFSISTGQSCNGNTINTLAITYNFGIATLKNGSRGEAVKELQRFLNQTFNLHLVIDGKLGPKTVAVIKQYQKINGLVVDGMVGVKTKAKMKLTPI